MIFRRKPTQRSLQSASFRRPRPSGAPLRLNHRRSLTLKRRRSIGKTLSASSETNAIKKRKPSRRGFFAKLKRWSLILMASALTIFIVYNLFFSEKLNLQNVEIFEDQKPLSDHPVKQVLQTFKDDNLLLLNTDAIQAFIQKKYPYYATVKLSKNLPDTLVLNLITHPVVANLIVKTPNEKKSLVLNAAGQAQTPEEGATFEQLPILLIERDQPLKEGEAIIAQDALAFILEANQNFEDKFGMKIEHAQYLAIPREVHLYTERNFYVWLDMSMELDTQLNKLKKALPRLNIYEESLDYIDLRISGIDGEKVIFKKV